MIDFLKCAWAYSKAHVIVLIGWMVVAVMEIINVILTKDTADGVLIVMMSMVCVLNYHRVIALELRLKDMEEQMHEDPVSD